ncbi:unannotated protein [freshwater metagenome]|uniref:Unannotated protein n=1 Tax=freshwater metagenome TaxID=449393 RepID=A0A6J7IXN9_9ZZZZ
MWIFTTEGFISAVYKHDAVQVRARDHKSLQNLATYCASEIKHTPVADYPYRLETDRNHLATWLSQQALLMEYGNFKSEVEAVRGFEFAAPLHKVWDVMHEVEDAKARIRR